MIKKPKNQPRFTAVGGTKGPRSILFSMNRTRIAQIPSRITVGGDKQIPHQARNEEWFFFCYFWIKPKVKRKLWAWMREGPE